MNEIYPPAFLQLSIERFVVIYQFSRQKATDTPVQHFDLTVATRRNPHTGADHTRFTADTSSPIRLLQTQAYRTLL